MLIIKEKQWKEDLHGARITNPRQRGDQVRYAFQGQEHDDETGFDYFKYRMYDAEIGRFNGVDPLRGKYPHNSAFAFSENRVVDGVELEGMENRSFQYHYAVNGQQIGPAVMDYLADWFLEPFLTTASGTTKYYANEAERHGQSGYNEVVPENVQEFRHNLNKLNAQTEIVDGTIGIFDRAMTIATLPIGGELTGAKTAAKFGAGLGDDVAKGIVVHFGRTENQVYHAFRHTDRLGLERNLVQEAVESHFKNVAREVVSGEAFNRTVKIAGKEFQYTAWRLEDGSFNIGRIHGQ